MKHIKIQFIIILVYIICTSCTRQINTESKFSAVQQGDLSLKILNDSISQVSITPYYDSLTTFSLGSSIVLLTNSKPIELEIELENKSKNPIILFYSPEVLNFLDGSLIIPDFEGGIDTLNSYINDIWAHVTPFKKDGTKLFIRGGFCSYSSEFFEIYKFPKGLEEEELIKNAKTVIYTGEKKRYKTLFCIDYCTNRSITFINSLDDEMRNSITSFNLRIVNSFRINREYFTKHELKQIEKGEIKVFDGTII